MSGSLLSRRLSGGKLLKSFWLGRRPFACVATEEGPLQRLITVRTETENAGPGNHAQLVEMVRYSQTGHEGRPHCSDGEIDLCRVAIAQMVQSTPFEGFIVFSIAWNTCIMAILGPEQKEGSIGEAVAHWTSTISVPIYTAEALLKMYGFGLWGSKTAYFRDSWCLFDFVVVSISWVDLIISLMIAGSSGVNILFLRLMKFARVFRIIKGTSKLQASRVIIKTITKGFYNSRYVLLFIFFFVVLACTLGLNW